MGSFADEIRYMMDEKVKELPMVLDALFYGKVRPMISAEEAIQGITASLEGVRASLVRIAEEIDNRVPPPLTTS